MCGCFQPTVVNGATCAKQQHQIDANVSKGSNIYFCNKCALFFLNADKIAITYHLVLSIALLNHECCFTINII